jgi:ribosome-binding protein aMBF1 (putative translation factor)
MGKSHRGKGLWKLTAKGRGTCPVCHRTRVKVIYPLTVNGATVNVCKHCRRKTVTQPVSVASNA